MDPKIVKLANDIHVSMGKEDISTCHRIIGNGRKPRPDIVRFVTRSVKSNIMKAKKVMRHKADMKDIYINDDLTKLRHRIVKAMKATKCS